MEFLNLTLLAFIGSVAGLIGGIILLIKEEWADNLTKISVPFASGVLLSLSFLDLLPEAHEQIGDNAFYVVFSVFIIVFLIEKFFFALHHHKSSKSTHNHQGTVSVVIFGDTIHNFLDGMAIGAAFTIEPTFGLMIALGTFLHETPHEIADFGILLSKGWSRKNAFIANLFSAMATFPGAFIAYAFADIAENSVGILLALAAGLFLYVSTTDFLPQLQQVKNESQARQLFFLLAGIAAVLALRYIVPEVGH